VDVTRIEMGVSRPRAPLGARYMHLHLSLDTCICRWILRAERAEGVV
jgi:hypothetical protein